MKVITVVLILAMFYSFMACYSSKVVSQKDEIKDVFGMDEGFYLYTKNSETYYFHSPFLYMISNDKLVGSGQVVIDNSIGPSEHVKIAIEDITKIEVEELDGTRTTVAAVVAVASVIALYYIVKSQDDKHIIF